MRSRGIELAVLQRAYREAMGFTVGLGQFGAVAVVLGGFVGSLGLGFEEFRQGLGFRVWGFGFRV